MDQAQSLREYMHRFNARQQQGLPSRVITITSGKGGVGKSNFTLNFALGLKSMGKKAVVLDLDLSTANLHILMGLTPRYSLADVVYGRKTIWDAIELGASGVEYIACGLELDELMQMDQDMLSFFWSQIQELQGYADFILLDTGAGISKELMDFILAADETIIITTPEPTAIADSYAVMKTVFQFTKEAPAFRLVVNRAQTYREAVETSRTLKNACSHFLKFNLKTIGFLMEDTHVRQAVKTQIPFLLSSPNCEASKNVKQIVYSYLPEMEEFPAGGNKGIRGFFEKIFTLGRSS